MAAARAVGRHAGERDARAPRRLPLPGALGRHAGGAGACSSPATPRTRCRRSPARGCARACATPPTWPGSSISCWREQGARRAARHLRERAHPARARGHRLLDGARQGDLRRRSRRGGGARRRDDRRRQGRPRARAAAAAGTRAGSAARGRPARRPALRAGPRAARAERPACFDDVVGRGWTLLSPSVDPARAPRRRRRRVLRRASAASARTSAPTARCATSTASTPSGSRAPASPSSCSARTSTSSALHPPVTVPACSSARFAVPWPGLLDVEFPTNGKPRRWTPAAPVW